MPIRFIENGVSILEIDQPGTYELGGLLVRAALLGEIFRISQLLEKSSSVGNPAVVLSKRDSGPKRLRKKNNRTIQVEFI